jgi:dienelactone hydrolase
VIHRDLKPSNILITEYNHEPVPKIIDFGVAKSRDLDLHAENQLTKADQIVGTLQYMSPEQTGANQREIDTRSDIYGLGAILHELLTGEIPLAHEFRSAETLEQHLSITREIIPRHLSRSVQLSDKQPQLSENRNTTPAGLKKQLAHELDWIVARSLEKAPDDRYATAKSFSDDIERFCKNVPVQARPHSIYRKTKLFVRRHRYQVTAYLLMLLMLTVLSLTSLVIYLEDTARRNNELELAETSVELERARDQARQLQEAREIIAPKILDLINDQQTVAAYQMMQSLDPRIKADAAFEEIMSDLMLTTSLDKFPPNTSVKIRDAASDNDQWISLGRTPLINIKLPRGPIRIRFEKSGYISRDLQLKIPKAFDTSACSYLVPNEAQLAGMVWIYRNENEDGVPIEEFWIDRLEVSNEDFQAFVDAGGYQDPSFWEGINFTQKEETIPWQQAMGVFTDSTGTPSPAGWKNGHYPNGNAKHPVGGVSWFEARAYAKFCSKHLPTLHHWKWAADTDQPGIIAAAGNFLSSGPTPCGAMTGVGRFDALDLAGNVREWCQTADEEGKRYNLGGDWNSPHYSFSTRMSISPWDRSLENGFRCVWYPKESEPSSEALASVAQPKDLDLGPDREPFQRLRAMYLYDHDLPLDATIQPANDSESTKNHFRHEVVEINAAYNNERFKVHLLIPNDRVGKMETIIFVPGVTAWENGRELKVDQEPHVGLLKRLAGAGKIVCFPVYQGTYERWSGNTLSQQFSNTPIRARDDYIAVTKDGSRVVDYLITRQDVDPKRLVYFGLSNGALRGPMALATDTRYRAAVLLSGGYVPHHKNRPEIQAFHYTPEVKQPILMMNGTSDQVFPVETSQKPLFADLGSLQKKHILFSADHIIDAHEVFNTMTEWLEEEAFQGN